MWEEWGMSGWGLLQARWGKERLGKGMGDNGVADWLVGMAMLQSYCVEGIGYVWGTLR